MAAGWDLEADPRHLAQPSKPPRGARRRAERSDSGQPVGKDDGKRGVRGYDAAKKVNGRKRHLLVDTLGLLLAVVVHAADIQDREGAKLVLEKIKHLLPRLQLIWADGGYAGQLVEWVQHACGWLLEIVRRPKGVKGFVALPRRWVVERTFGWFNRYRRLSKDCELLTETGEAMIYLAITHIMVRRLARNAQPSGP
jgi:putative transposase